LNYLAHIFLSGKDSDLQIGNFIGDFVKGNQFNDFPEGIRNGIILHRSIDHFTDNHEIVKETISFVIQGLLLICILIIFWQSIFRNIPEVNRSTILHTDFIFTL